MFRSLGLLCCCVFLLGGLRAQVFSDNNFISENLHFGNGIVSLEFLPDGTLLAAEKRGVLLAFSPDGNDGFNAPITLLDLSAAVDATQEAGLLGLALDPEYAITGHIYMFYTTPTDQRVVRVTYTGTPPINPATETVILSGLPRAVTFHKGGDIEFHPNQPQHLYLATGDDGGEGLIDEGGIPRVQHPDWYHGKILKIDKNTGLGLTTNPFYQGDTDTVRARVWAVGFRNPFRIVFHPEAPNEDVIYVSENGDGTDRISWVRMGSNGSWNAIGDNGGFLDPPDPNHHVMAAVAPSRVGLIIATQPPFAIDGIPTVYNGKWFPNPALVDRWHLTGNDLDTLTSIAADNGDPFADGLVAVDFVFGPDGYLYTCETLGDDSIASFLILRRIKFVGGTAPSAAFTTNPNPAEGFAPLAVQFSDQSVAGSAAITTWAWDFGNGDTSSMQNPNYTYNQPGAYTVQLRVTQGDGLNDVVTGTVNAFQGTTVNLSGTLFDGSDPSNVTPLAAASTLGFYQADGITPVPVPGGSGANENFLDVAAGGVFDFSVTFSLTDDAFVVSAGEASGDNVSSAKAGFLLPAARGSNDYSFDFFLADAMVVGRTLDMREAPISIDLGVASDQEGTLLAVAGGRDFLPPLQASGTAHRVVSDALGYFHVAVPTAVVGSLLYFDIVGDTGNDQHPSRTAAALSQASTSREVEWLVGTFSGGLGCDDLSAIAETPNIDFASQIQPILTNNCTGCHTAAGSQNGGLDLTIDARPDLVNQTSSFVPGYTLVLPGNLLRSYLFEKINCADPQFGSRMRPTDAMSLADQALIRDWIVQLGESNCIDLLQPEAANWPETGLLSLVEWINLNCN